MSKASLEVTAHHQTPLENETQDLERKLHQTANQNADLTAKLDSTSSVFLHLNAETQLLLKELLSKQEVQNKCEKLEEEKKKSEEVMNLKRHLEMNTVERSQVQQDKRETEERARQGVVEKWKGISQFLQAQAPPQENVRE
ncbi:Ankyrin repeat domain-containing protein 26 [Camelus dromedarius]|uniref:Ankyrin repeat domain-containing protein 26 n=1 Tax=Camelus dromedarius TaxID=9838 RepID=A0A5N4E2I4_CAMDR|nr:Ankyrin repeat domain-containing protein 26 [Camelus dromedarius]